jgi:OOP family OmpA-OmpF porin
MWNPGRWWIGLVPVALLAVVSMWAFENKVEADVSARGLAAAAGAGGTFDGKPWASGTVAGRDLTLSGQAFDEASVTRAAQAADDTWGVRLVERNTALAPLADTFRWGLQRDDKQITLSGMVPGDGTRTAIVAAVGKAFPGLTVVDTMQAVRGAPAGIADAMGQLLAPVAGLANSKAAIEGTALSVSGIAPSGTVYETAQGALNALPAGVKLAKFDVALPKAADFHVTAIRDAAGIKLSGFAPDLATRAKILEAAKAAAGSGTVMGTLELASGAPAGVDQAAGAAFGLSLLKDLSAGTLVTRDTTLSLSGDAPSVQTRQATMTALQGVIQGGFKPGTIELRSPAVSPFTWSATRDGAKLKLAGYVSNEGMRKDLRELIGRRFPGASVEDTTLVADGAPRQFMAALNSGLFLLSRLDSGTLGLSDTSLNLTGEAFVPQAAAEIKAQLTALPAGFIGSGTIGARELPPLEAGACQIDVDNTLTTGMVQFQLSSSVIDPDSHGLLDKIAAAARRCQTATISIAGHTDTTGSPEGNLDLSNRRATSVADYLIAIGVDSSRITARGYGETRPIVPNDTPENRAKNRRIAIQFDAPPEAKP